MLRESGDPLLDFVQSFPSKKVRANQPNTEICTHARNPHQQIPPFSGWQSQNPGSLGDRDDFA